MSTSTPAPGSPNEKAVLEDIRLKQIEISRLADTIGWHWELNARPMGGRRRMCVVVTESERTS
jgi:hypothetical protein